MRKVEEREVGGGRQSMWQVLVLAPQFYCPECRCCGRPTVDKSAL